MRLLRSWPKHIPSGRTGYVVDDIERFVIDQYDLRRIGEVDDDVLLLEWDIAVSREDLKAFADRAQEEPKRVIVAPYRLYFETGSENPFADPVWAHRKFRDGAATPGVPIQVRGDVLPPIQEGEPFCHYFGVGMVYLPRDLIRGFLDDYLIKNPNAAFSDHLFSAWHFHNAPSPEVPITWDIRPVHLHYTARGM